MFNVFAIIVIIIFYSGLKCSVLSNRPMSNRPAKMLSIEQQTYPINK